MSSIEAELFDHRNNEIPFFEGWDKQLKAFLKPFPTIPNGGYTRGHFFEFFEGNVTMRDTITSEIFHEHRYLGNGAYPPPGTPHSRTYPQFYILYFVFCVLSDHLERSFSSLGIFE